MYTIVGLLALVCFVLDVTDAIHAKATCADMADWLSGVSSAAQSGLSLPETKVSCPCPCHDYLHLKQRNGQAESRQSSVRTMPAELLLGPKPKASNVSVRPQMASSGPKCAAERPRPVPWRPKSFLLQAIPSMLHRVELGVKCSCFRCSLPVLPVRGHFLSIPSNTTVWQWREAALAFACRART